MRKTWEPKSGDIEIQKLNPGPIISLFPQSGNAEDIVEDIVMGLFLLNQARTLPDKVQEVITDLNLEPEYVTLAFAEVERMTKINLEMAEKLAMKFFEDNPKMVKLTQK